MGPQSGRSCLEPANMKSGLFSNTRKVQPSSEGGKFIEFGFVHAGRHGAPDVHLKCRITATTRPSQQLQVPRPKPILERKQNEEFQKPWPMFGSWTRLTRLLPDVASKLQLLYQLVVCVPRKLAELQRDVTPQKETVLSDLPGQAPVEEKVLEWAEGLLRNGVPKIQVSPAVPADGFEADDEDDDDEFDEEDKSSGFFSDELSETDTDLGWTSDKQIQCSLGKFTLSKAAELERRKRLVTHGDLPNWLQNNEYLKEHHRPPLNSWRACARSVFSLHTESGNIWTHLLGAVGFLALGVHFFWSGTLELDWAGSLAFGIYFAGAALCLSLSAVYHTFSCHSARVCELFCKMDYCGITILILGSFYPWLYFQFMCEPIKRIVYGLLVSASGMLTLRVSMSRKFGEARYRGLRASIFFGFALVCGILPSGHYGLQHGWDDLMYNTSFIYILLMVAIYVTGCCVYATRVPERFFPGHCDLAFQSHQIFHVLVLLGALAHYYGLWRLAALRVSQGECPAGTTDSLFRALGVS